MTQLLQNAVYGTAMILAVALLRRVLKDKLAPGARLALWAACLFRLLTPAAPKSVLSLWGLLGQGAPDVPATAPAVPNGGGTFVPNPANVTAPAPVSAPGSPGIPWEMILLGIWLAVGAALGLRYAAAYIRTRRAVSCAILLGRDDPRYTPLPRYARLREGPMDGAPLTFGALRPTVVLSPGLSGAALECVLAHEGVHARRRDNLWHYVTAAALTVFWWNPAVWFMARLVRRDVELSCDRAALKKLGAARRAEYANALVSMATQAEGPAFCQTFGRKAAEERILSVMKYKKMTAVGVALSLVLVFAVTAGFASSPAGPDEESTTSSAPATLMTKVTGENGDDVEELTINLEFLEKNLAEHVADGSMTQEEADRVLAQARAFSEDGKALVWSFQGDSGLVFDHSQVVDADDFGVYYRDESGDLVPVDPATVVSGFILPEAVPTVEQGEPGGSDAWTVSLEEYKALLARLVADGKVSQEDADWLYAGAKERLDEAAANGVGDAVVLKTNETGSFAVMSAPVCTQPYCGNRDAHTHDGVTYSGWMGSGLVEFDGRTYNRTDLSQETLEWLGWYLSLPSDMSRMAVNYVPWELLAGWDVSTYDAAGELPDGVDGLCALPLASQAYAACGVAGCTETSHHTHSGGHCVLLGDPCPVAGCTLTGSHEHNGVMYSCSGAGHADGHCDGSCYTTSQPQPASTPARTNCYPDGSNHHSESHHSSGHHGSHH